MKLKHTAFANSIAVSSIVFYIVLYGTYFLFPNMYISLVRSYFLAPLIAGLLPPVDFARSIMGGVVIVGVLSWIFGYAWAFFYNSFAYKRLHHHIHHHRHAKARAAA